MCDWIIDSRKDGVVTLTSLLTELKCGGQALNLIMANQALIVDPWCNHNSELQAFDRVQRMVQEKTTHIVRILTKSHIDRHIEYLQRTKSSAIVYALQDDGHVPGPTRWCSAAEAFGSSEGQ